MWRVNAKQAPLKQITIIFCFSIRKHIIKDRKCSFSVFRFPRFKWKIWNSSCHSVATEKKTLPPSGRKANAHSIINMQSWSSLLFFFRWKLWTPEACNWQRCYLVNMVKCICKYVRTCLHTRKSILGGVMGKKCREVQHIFKSVETSLQVKYFWDLNFCLLHMGSSTIL